MKRYFNITGACNPKYHYMVNIQPRLEKIKNLIDRGAYFTINCARQYGKTTTLSALKTYLKPDYVVVGVDFQMLSHASFKSEESFVRAFAREIHTAVQDMEPVPAVIKKQLADFSSAVKEEADLGTLFFCLSDWCRQSPKPVVLMIDEVDSATNNQVFLDFLAQLRGYYIHREDRAAFQSVILASVYDVKNIQYKAASLEEHGRKNSPWNIATDFMVDMNFSADSIEKMLGGYAADHDMEMDTEAIAGLIYYPKLRKMLYSLLFTGKNIVYNPDDEALDMAVMFGFVKNDSGNVVVANRIFETRLYNMFLAQNDVLIIRESSSLLN